MAVTVHPDLAAFDRLKTCIQGLRSKTMDNGCTEAEALLAAAKVAELLDRYDLSLSDVEIRNGQCEQRSYETRAKSAILWMIVSAISRSFAIGGFGVRKAIQGMPAMYSSVFVPISKLRIT